MILISDPDKAWCTKISEFLKTNNQLCETSFSGKECQLFIYKKNPKTVILDIDTTAHSGLEVLKYLKLNYPLIKVILSFSSSRRLEELQLSKSDLLALGVSEIFVKPYTMEKLLASLLAVNRFEAWKDIVSTEGKPNEITEEFSVKDDEFTRIRLEAFMTGNTTIFDFYIRLSPNKYVKVLHKGEFFDDTQIKRYTKSGKVEYLYFKTSDRGVYINFINQLLEKSIASDKGDMAQKVGTTKVLVEKFIEEIYVQGLNPELVDEGINICQNIFNLVQRDVGLNKVLKEFQDYDPPSYAHLFLTAFVSTIICKNLDWATSRSVEFIAMGALFHDIGKLKFPLVLRDKAVADMNENELIIYKKHPLYGAELLAKYPDITDPVKQIVYQHHEFVNGTGFPNGLSGVKIYPLAKVVSLANAFTETIVFHKLPPFEGLKLFIPDKQLTARFDPVLMKALVTGFLKEK